MSKPSEAKVNEASNIWKDNTTPKSSSPPALKSSDRSLVTTTPTPASNLSAAQYIYDSMRDTQSKSNVHQMMIQARHGLLKKEGSNTSIKGRLGLEKTFSSNSMRPGLEKMGSNRSIMSGVLSIDMFPDDMDLHGGLISLQADSKRSINSSDFVKYELLRDGSQLTLGRGISDRDILKSSDLPLAELTAELGRITTGDDIIGENIRMSSSEWVKDFQNGPVVVGPMPQSMFHDSFSSIPDATGSASRSVLGAVPARVRYDKNTPYDRALSPILSSGGVQINSSLPLPALSSNIDNRTENVFSGSLKDDKISSQSKTKKRRKRVIDESTACVPTEDDVLFGRGGFTNNRPGNIFFRQEALNLRSWYEQSSKEEKYNISNLLLESVKSRGGRFLEKGSDGLWHEVIGNGARRKASQALRERIKGRGTSVLSSSITSARSHESSRDVHNNIGANESLVPSEVDLAEV